jgi:hypothetical protein
LLSDETDPFNRAPLTESMLQPGGRSCLLFLRFSAFSLFLFTDLELLERIQAYKRSKAKASADLLSSDVYSS